MVYSFSMDGSDVETIATLARNRVAGSLERNGLAESGFDLMKGLGIGFVLGRVSLRGLSTIFYKYFSSELYHWSWE